jgi:hypothetical protein
MSRKKKRGITNAMVAEMSDVEGLEPCSLAEAKQSPDWLFWEKAIVEELKTLEEAGTWELVDPHFSHPLPTDY